MKTTLKLDEEITNSSYIVKIPEIHEFLSRIKKIIARIKDLEDEKQGLDKYIRTEAKIKMIELYSKDKILPKTIKFISGKLSFLFTTKDKYPKIEENKAKILKIKYNKDIITEEHEYILNPKIFPKYLKLFKDFIENSKNIDPADKKELLIDNVYYSISKGVIENLRNDTYKKYNIVELIDDIQPEFSIKY